MTINDLINQSVFKFPLNRTNEDFPTYIEHFLNNYYKLINNIEGDYADKINEQRDIIRKLNINLIQSAKKYYKGHIPDAYKYFEEGLQLIKPYLKIDNPSISVDYTEERRNQLRNDSYFKARVSVGKSLNKKEMFIRPFEQREDIQTYRYSIPGLPCLYLSNNIYTTWNELNCPDINSIQISKFKLVDIKKLHFGHDISYHKYMIDNEKVIEHTFDKMKELVNYLTYFPLHALCNIKVFNSNGKFIPEYIFPQFLMQWVSQQRIDCIEYMSTQIDYSMIDIKMPHMFFNLAIPAQSTNQTGCCEKLRKKLKLSEPISWQNLISSYPQLQFPARTIQEPHNYLKVFKRFWEIELIKGKKVSYNDSIFGIMENYLDEHLDVDFL